MNLFAQQSIARIGVSYTAGKIIKHTQKLSLDPPNFSNALEINITTKPRKNYLWRSNFGQPTTGYAFSFINSIDARIGQVYSVMPTIAFRIEHTKKMNCSIRIGSGLAYATRYWQRIPLADTINNYLGSRFNLYASIGVQAHYKIASNWQAVAAATLSHTSNAGIRKPNFGINLVGATIGLQYQLCDEKNLQKKLASPINFSKNKLGFNMRLGGSMAEAGLGDGPLMPIYTAAFFASYTYHQKHKLLLGIDYEYNGKTEFFIRTTRQAYTSMYKDAGYLAAVVGNEFLLGRFSIPVQIGYYLNAKYLKVANTYNKFGLLYYPTFKKNRYGNGLYVGTILKTNAFTADYLECCIGTNF
jgi:Lipid A 3-O-deacylase (PagL)